MLERDSRQIKVRGGGAENGAGIPQTYSFP
jgi:hypothetical protein